MCPDLQIGWEEVCNPGVIESATIAMCKTGKVLSKFGLTEAIMSSWSSVIGGLVGLSNTAILQKLVERVLAHSKD